MAPTFSGRGCGLVGCSVLEVVRSVGREAWSLPGYRTTDYRVHGGLWRVPAAHGQAPPLSLVSTCRRRVYALSHWYPIFPSSGQVKNHTFATFVDQEVDEMDACVERASAFKNQLSNSAVPVGWGGGMSLGQWMEAQCFARRSGCRRPGGL